MKKISKVLLLVIVAVAFCFGITGQQVQAKIRRLYMAMEQ